MNIAIILTGGNGSRLSNVIPKQFIKINNKELFIYPLEVFKKCKLIDKIVLVINKEYKNQYIKILDKYNEYNDIILVYGGLTRQDSVYNAINALSTQKTHDEDIIIIHDGARANIDEDIIIKNINQIQKYHNPVTTICNIVDTIVDKDYNLLDRNYLFKVQTPQTFLFKQISLLHSLAKKDLLSSVSDDAQLAKRYGLKLDYVYGSNSNFKITTSDDLDIFKSIKRR